MAEKKMSDTRAQQAPPEHLKAVYKAFHKLDTKSAFNHPDLIDTERALPGERGLLRPSSAVQLPPELRQIFLDFLSHKQELLDSLPAELVSNPTIYEVESLPGLFIYPSLLPPAVQLHLLDTLLHRDLSNPEHMTNVHFHHDIPYPPANKAQSFFSPSASTLSFTPKDPTLHKPLTTQQFLNKKLRWLTLGGQYDWTNKVYPDAEPPPFPPDIKALIEEIFPMKAEAAIVNLYSPGDTLSLHRDVSEECNRPLVSISLGCDGLFLVGLDGEGEGGEARTAIIRLRSGDAVLMSGESRYAWHGVPKVVEGTCPSWMGSWPAGEEEKGGGGNENDYGKWKGWMKGRRVNLNVRQMFDGGHLAAT